MSDRPPPPNPRDPGLQDARASPAAEAQRLAKTLSATNAGIGLWLVVAPFVLFYGTRGAVWNDVACGLLLAALGALRFGRPDTMRWASWTNAGIGAWLVVAPSVLGHVDRSAFWNDVTVGALVVVLGVSSALATPRPGPGEPPAPRV